MRSGGACLVTGATGLVGRRVVELLASEREVVACGRRAEQRAWGAGARALKLDLAGPWRADELPARIDAVLHLAQSEHYRRFPEQAGDLFRVNVESTFRLLEWARAAGARRFVVASSGGVYGHGERPFRETDPIVASSELGFYLGTKACAEALATSYARHFAVVVLRPFFIYGPGQDPGFLVPRLVRAIQAGEPLTLQGPDGMRFNPLHADDAARAFARALEVEVDGTDTINVAGPEVLTLRQVGEAIGRVLGAEARFASAPGAPRHLVADVSRMVARLGPADRRFGEAVRELVQAG